MGSWDLRSPPSPAKFNPLPGLKPQKAAMLKLNWWSNRATPNPQISCIFFDEKHEKSGSIYVCMLYIYIYYVCMFICVHIYIYTYVYVWYSLMHKYTYYIFTVRNKTFDKWVQNQNDFRKIRDNWGTETSRQSNAVSWALYPPAN